MTRRAPLGLLLLALALPLLAHADTPDAPPGAWTRTFDSEIRWQKLTDTGYLLLSTDDALYSLEPETGEIAWTITEHGGIKEDYVELIPLTPLAVMNVRAFVNSNRTIVIDVVEGKTLWTSDEQLGLDPKKGGLVFGQHYLPEVGGMLVFTSEGTMLADAHTGAIRWTNADLYGKGRGLTQHKISERKMAMRASTAGNQEPLFDTDHTFLLLMGEHMYKVDATSGQVLWESEMRFKGGPPALKWGYPSIILSEDRQTVYVPYGDTIVAIRTADGGSVWKKGPNLRGKPFQMQLAPEGLVVYGGAAPEVKKSKPFIDVIAYGSGASIWKKPFKDLKDASGFSLRNGEIVLYADKDVHAIRIADGSSREVARKVKIDGEVPYALEVRDGGYLLRGSQNLLLLSFDGEERYHAYHAAPGLNRWVKLAGAALITAANAASAADGYARASANAQRSATGVGTASYSTIGYGSLSKRFSKTANANDHQYILTKIENDEGKGVGLVKVNKDTGATVGEVILKDKEPEYELDEFAGLIFYRSGQKEITCYRL